MEANRLTIDMFEQKRGLAGIVCLVSNMDKEGIDMFDLYNDGKDMGRHLMR